MESTEKVTMWDQTAKAFDYHFGHADRPGPFALVYAILMRGSELGDVPVSALATFTSAIRLLQAESKPRHFAPSGEYKIPGRSQQIKDRAFLICWDEYTLPDEPARDWLSNQFREAMLVGAFKRAIKIGDDTVDLTGEAIKAAYAELKALRGTPIRPLEPRWIILHRAVRLFEDVALHLIMQDDVMSEHIRKSKAEHPASRLEDLRDDTYREIKQEYELARLLWQPDPQGSTASPTSVPFLRLIKGGIS